MRPRGIIIRLIAGSDLRVGRRGTEGAGGADVGGAGLRTEGAGLASVIER